MPIHNAPSGESAGQALIGGAGGGDTQPEAWDLSGVSPTWVITGALAVYAWAFADAMSSQSLSGPYGSNAGGGSSSLGYTYNGAGLAWIAAHAGEGDAVSGDYTATVEWVDPPSILGCQVHPDYLQITYTEC